MLVGHCRVVQVVVEGLWVGRDGQDRRRDAVARPLGLFPEAVQRCSPLATLELPCVVFVDCCGWREVKGNEELAREWTSGVVSQLWFPEGWVW